MDAHAVIQKLGGGNAIEEFHAALLSVAEETLATGNQGTVTLKVKVEKMKGGDPIVILSEEVGRTPPKGTPKGALLYQLDGEFFTKDPRQTTFELRTVDGGQSELRSPEDAGTAVREVE